MKTYGRNKTYQYDMLDAGIDKAKIVNLVFFKRAHLTL
jgi:hypothetical protein